MTTITRMFGLGDDSYKALTRAAENKDCYNLRRIILRTSTEEIRTIALKHLVNLRPYEAESLWENSNKSRLPNFGNVVRKILRDWADDPCTIGKYIKANDPTSVGVVVRFTSFKEIGTEGLKFLINSPLSRFVRNIAMGEDDRVMPELKIVAADLYQGWVNNPVNLASFLTLGGGYAREVMEIVENTTNPEIARSGLEFVVGLEIGHQWVRDIIQGTRKAKLLALPLAAGDVYKKWINNPNSLSDCINRRDLRGVLDIAKARTPDEAVERALNFLASNLRI